MHAVFTLTLVYPSVDLHTWKYHIATAVLSKHDTQGSYHSWVAISIWWMCL